MAKNGAAKAFGVLVMGINISTAHKGKGKSMRSYIREKQIFCGTAYKEVDIYPYTAAQEQGAKKGRGKRERVSEPKQKNLNDKNSARYFRQLVETNFGESGGVHISLTYTPRHCPKTLEEAEKIVGNYLRRVNCLRKKKGLKPMRRILVTSITDPRTGSPARVHHHLIADNELSRDELEDLWRMPRRAGEKKGQKIGYANADRLQADEEGLGALCRYLARNTGGKKRWSASHNLKKPTQSVRDDRYSPRQVQKLCRSMPDKEYWEKKYPGWTPEVSGGAQYEWNEVTGNWSIRLKLRKKAEYDPFGFKKAGLL